MLTPGLVNAHTHLDLTAFRGLLRGLPFYSWVRELVALRAELADRDFVDGARAGIAEGLRAGVTTFADTAPTGASFDAMLEMGVRGVAYREVFGPDPAQREAALAALIATVREARERETDLVRVGVSPHAPYSVSDALFTGVADFARAEGFPLATHIAESEEESALVRAADGPFADFLRSRQIRVSPRAGSPIALLRQTGVLGESALLIHCVHCDDTDITAIVGHGCGVAACPSSNAFLLGQHARVGTLRAAGARLGVGSDSMASNDAMDVLREAHLAARLVHPGETAAGSSVVWYLATMGGARALRLDHVIGSLEVGKQADLAAFPLSALDHPGFEATSSQASFVAVGGNPLVRHGALVAPVADAIRRTDACTVRLHGWLENRPPAR